MAVTVSATYADDASGWTAVGDRDWVPDVDYYRRFVLSCTGSAGEVGTVVNWEIYDSTDMHFVSDAATVTVQASGGNYTGATAPAFLNNRATQTIWVRNAKAQGAGAPYYDETGKPWISVLRANGPRVTVVLPVTLKWAAGVVDRVYFEVAAYLPGSGRVPAGTIEVEVNNPDSADRKMLAAPQGSSADLPEPEPEQVELLMESPEPEPETQAVPDIAYDESWTVNEVKQWVGDDVDRALEAYTREQARSAGERSTLIEWLAPMLLEE